VRGRDQMLSEADAAAEERIGAATADTAPVLALEAKITPANRDSLVLRAYREQIAAIMGRVGSVTAIDMRRDQRLILPGPTP
jgi:regulator of protease activity HflC (stomatin/prohibitin superfamily)